MRRLAKAALAGLVAVAAYVLVAYVVLPLAWDRYEHQPGLADVPMVTRTATPERLPAPVVVQLRQTLWPYTAAALAPEQ